MPFSEPLTAFEPNARVGQTPTRQLSATIIRQKFSVGRDQDSPSLPFINAPVESLFSINANNQAPLTESDLRLPGGLTDQDTFFGRQVDWPELFWGSDGPGDPYS